MTPKQSGFALQPRPLRLKKSAVAAALIIATVRREAKTVVFSGGFGISSF